MFSLVALHSLSICILCKLLKDVACFLVFKIQFYSPPEFHRKPCCTTLDEVIIILNEQKRAIILETRF